VVDYEQHRLLTMTEKLIMVVHHGIPY